MQLPTFAAALSNFSTSVSQLRLRFENLRVLAVELLDVCIAARRHSANGGWSSSWCYMKQRWRGRKKTRTAVKKTTTQQRRWKRLPVISCLPSEFCSAVEGRPPLSVQPSIKYFDCVYPNNHLDQPRAQRLSSTEPRLRDGGQSTVRLSRGKHRGVFFIHRFLFCG